MTFSALVTMNSLTTSVATIAGSDTPTSGRPLYNLIAALALSLVGIIGVIQGYCMLVQNRGWKSLNMIAVVLTQLAWLPFLGGLTGVGSASQAPPAMNGFINPEVYPDVTSADVKLVGAMGILSILTYASSFVGSVGFFQFAILAYQKGDAGKYSAVYYRGRQLYYSMLVLIAGVAQVILGAHVLSRFGNGPLPAPIGAGPIVVTFPELSIVVGVIQIVVGSLGSMRRFGISTGFICTYMYQSLCLFLWVSMLSIQILVQIGYPAGADLVANAPTLGCMYFALSFMPAFLDHQANTLPEELPADYYTARKDEMNSMEIEMAEEGAAE